MPRRSSTGNPLIGHSKRTKPDESVVHLFRVKHPITKKVAKAGEHENYKAGIAWATRELGIIEDAIKRAKDGGPADVKAITDELVALMVAAGKSEDWISDIRSIGHGAHAAGLVDLKAPGFGVGFATWVNGLRAGWTSGKKDGRELAQNTLNGYCRAFRRIVEHARKKGLTLGLTWDPLADGADFLPPPEIVTKEVFEISELQKMVSDETRRKTDWWLPWCLLIYTGARISEAMHIKWEHIKWESSRVVIDKEFAKGGKERWCWLQPELRDALLSVLRMKGLHPLKATGWIISDEYMRSNGSHLRHFKRTKPADPAYSKPFKRALASIGITPGERTPHSTRFTHISVIMATGVDVQDVMPRVGHEQIQTTMGYGVSRDAYLPLVRGRWPEWSLCLRRKPDPTYHLPVWLGGKALELDAWGDNEPIVVELTEDVVA